jgi:protein-S-isoprenylcysteine O-methyltransferase Ste14
MIVFFDVLLIFLFFFLFAVSHTILASEKVKQAIILKSGDKIAFYRLFYNLSSLLIIGVFWSIAPRPDIIIYDLQYPFDIIIFVFQILSLFGLIWAGTYIDLQEFTGISQVKRYINGTYETDDLDERAVLRIEGPFKYCRHPIYLFSILFIGLRPVMDLFYLVFFVCATLYFIIGSYYEEEKLSKKFKDEYTNYQKKVSRLIPKIY